jgi:hypothetical protein
MGNVRPDADHIEIKRLKEKNIVGERLAALAGNPDHDARTGLKADEDQSLENLNAIGDDASVAGVNISIKLAIRGFEAEEVTVGAGAFEGDVVVDWAFAKAEGDGQRRRGFNLFNQGDNPACIEEVVFAGLENEGPMAKLDGFFSALKDFIDAHAIALEGFIGVSQAAVGASAATIVGYFDEATKMDFFANVFDAGLIGAGVENFQLVLGVGGEIMEDFVAVKHGAPR